MRYKDTTSTTFQNKKTESLYLLRFRESVKHLFTFLTMVYSINSLIKILKEVDH